MVREIVLYMSMVMLGDSEREDDISWSRGVNYKADMKNTHPYIPCHDDCIVFITVKKTTKTRTTIEIHSINH